MHIELISWQNIRHNFTDAVLLGNGASISIAKSFGYPSLYKAAEANDFLTGGCKEVFKEFETQDFELVLRMLANAYSVNRHLGISESKTQRAYKRVKEALAKTVRHVHPQCSEIEPRLRHVAEFLKKFDTVFSLNYDLVVYWAMMKENTRTGQNLFKDCFGQRGKFYEKYEFLREPHGDATTATLVFYPHGNLVLVLNSDGDVSKIVAEDVDLLTEFESYWRIGDDRPLIVAEGRSNAKLDVIGGNTYLRSVYQELSGRRDSLVVYGWAFGEQDSHIIKALEKSRLERVAISVFTPKEDWEDDCVKIKKLIVRNLKVRPSEIFFFDSSDPGVFANRPISILLCMKISDSVVMRLLVGSM